MCEIRCHKFRAQFNCKNSALALHCRYNVRLMFSCDPLATSVIGAQICVKVTYGNLYEL